MNTYRVARVKLIEHKWRSVEQTEHLIDVHADRMEEQGGMLRFWCGDELIAVFHLSRWLCATKL